MYLDIFCCDEVGYLYKLEGVDCFCDEVRLLIVLYFILNVNKVSFLFRDCKLFVGVLCFMIFLLVFFVFFVFFLLFMFGFVCGIYGVCVVFLNDRV